MTSDAEHYLITTLPDAFEQVKKAIEGKHVPIEHAELQMVPENTIKVEGKDAETLIKLIEGLEDHDDIQHVYGNFDIDESVLASLNAG
jgi:transcriptional/translational regulatory protein YebC/TACO1